jgi:hypothetical protein
MYLTIPEIILLATAIIGTAAIACYLTWLDKREAEEGMMWWAGVFLRLATEVITTQGYTINVDPDGKITMTKKEDLSDLKKPRKEAPAGDERSPQSESSSWQVQSYYASHPTPEGKNPQETAFGKGGRGC